MLEDSVMQVGSVVPWWMRANYWMHLIAAMVANEPAIRRDAKLRKYAAELRWTEAGRSVLLMIERVIAESEMEARELANAEVVRKLPIIVLPFGGGKMVPPYARSARSTLALWKVTELPLTEAELDLQRKGELGPPHAGLPTQQA